jgi:hypothetical protein
MQIEEEERVRRRHRSGAPDHAQAAVGQLKLNDGEKWATDAPLHAGRIEAQVNSIVANCRLPPGADANLHYVIADLSQGVSLMRGGDPARTRHDGAALVHGALSAYDTFFDAGAGAP